MRKLLVVALAVGAVCALVAGPSAFAKREVSKVGNLEFSDDGGITPTKLPRHKPAPITGHIDAWLRTTDGSHPPAIRTVLVDFDKTLHVNAKGLPACKKGQVEARNTAAAKRACPDSIVGTGSGEVEVEFAESAPFSARGPLVLFNGGVSGKKTRLYVHTYVAVPAPTAVVVPVEITPINRGHYGLHTISKIPQIAGGAGSPTKFKFDIGRKFTYKGKKQSYLTATCPTGNYYVEGKIEFANGPSMGLTHVLPCTPKD